jgi:hypothetical protein
MDRVKALIGQLQEQLVQRTPPATMLVTVQLLQAALEDVLADQKKAPSLGTAKVAVVLPFNNRSLPVAHEISEKMEVVVKEEVSNTPTIATKETQKEEKKLEKNNWQYDPIREIPTLAHQPGSKELNDVIGESVTGTSLNERLKSRTTELGDSLTDAPIKDLKKAIGVNDRYLFLNELFRGDEDMYERSLKTINNFKVLQEAEYWIERELKIKQAWDDSKESTRHFYQLVKRRFS